MTTGADGSSGPARLLSRRAARLQGQTASGWGVGGLEWVHLLGTVGPSNLLPLQVHELGHVAGGAVSGIRSAMLV